MTDRVPIPEETPDRYPGTPGWVKAVGIAILLVLLIAAFIVATGLGGPHGPQRHGGGALIAAAPAGRALVA